MIVGDFTYVEINVHLKRNIYMQHHANIFKMAVFHLFTYPI